MKDLDISQFEMRKGEGTPADIAPVYEAIGPFGKPVPMGDTSAVAYSTTNPITKKVSRFILKATAGTHILGKLFDPDAHGAEPRKNFAFSPVDEQTWRHYITYLETHKSTYLRYAERVA